MVLPPRRKDADDHSVSHRGRKDGDDNSALVHIMLRRRCRGIVCCQLRGVLHVGVRLEAVDERLALLLAEAVCPVRRVDLERDGLNFSLRKGHARHDEA